MSDEPWMSRAGCVIVLLSATLTVAAVVGIAWWVAS